MLRPWNAPVSLPGWVSCLLYSCFYPGRPPWKATLQALTIHTSAYRFTAAYRTVRTCWLRFFPLFAFFLSSLFLTSLTFLYLSVSSTCVHHHLLHLRVLFPLYKVLSWFVLSQPFPPINLSWLLSLLDPLSLSLSLSLSPSLSSEWYQRQARQRGPLSLSIRGKPPPSFLYRPLFILCVSLVQRSGKNLSRNSSYSAILRYEKYRQRIFYLFFLFFSLACSFAATAGMLIEAWAWKLVRGIPAEKA